MKDKNTILAIFVAIILACSPLFAQSYNFPNKYGQNNRIVRVSPNYYRQYNYKGQIQGSYRFYGKNVYSFDKKGIRR